MERTNQSSFMETEILFEIALSIGSSLDLDKMLHKTLFKMIRSLNLNGLVIYTYDEKITENIDLNQKDEAVVWNSLFSFPRKFNKKIHIVELLSSIKLPTKKTGLKEFYNNLPLSYEVNDNYVYILPLQELGILIIQKSGIKLRKELVLSLQKILNNLSYAARVCRYDEILQKKIEFAQEANNVKSQFLANMSHEVRTPLNSIIGFSELLLMESLPPKMQERVQYIHKSGSLLLNIMNDLLDYSELEKGHLSISKDVFNIHDIILHLSSIYIEICRKKGLSLAFDIDNKLNKWFSGDSLRLTQVLSNLLSNAVKFTERGGIVLKIVENSTDENVVFVAFSVSDTGIGLSDEQRESLFFGFNQVDMSSTRKYGGVGLGLAISQKLINLMGGSGITIKSQLQAGSVFEFSIPLLIEPKPIDENIDRKTLFENNSVIFNGEKILVVEDSLINQKIVKSLLERMNLSSEIANNGLEAVKKARENKYDLILMDIQMPVMDGYTATMKIREENPFVPIVALTAVSMLEDGQTALNVGMNDYVGKPIISKLLSECLKKWLVPKSTSYNPINNQLESSHKSTILIVDDIEININLLSGILVEDYCIKSARSGKDAIDIILNQEKPDLILLDIIMSDMDGFDVCKIIKSNPLTSNIPVIFITALDDIESEAKGLDMGAVDYITKPFNAKVIRSRIRNHLIIKKNSDFLKEISHIDPLTELSNRRHLNFILENEFRDARRSQSSLGIIMIDIDYFKNINDYYGHGTGDEYLRKVSKLLKIKLKRPRDFIARFGGEEFIIILPDTDKNGTLFVAEEMRKSVENAFIPNARSAISNFLTISVGSTLLLEEDKCPNSLIERSDRALYLAKSEGRNRVKFTTA